MGGDAGHKMLGIRIERKPLKTAKKCRKNIAVVLCLLRRSFCVRFLGLTHTLTHTANKGLKSGGVDACLILSAAIYLFFDSFTSPAP